MEVHTWQVAVSELRRAIEELGVMAVINGVVGNNTNRRLSVEEFAASRSPIPMRR